MQPVLCLITDRARAAGDDDLVARVQAAARAGIHLVQVRERDLDGGVLLRLVERCVAATRGTRTRVLVNDRLDVAMAAGADGVHLRSDSISAHRARAIAPRGFLVGRSVHGVDEVRDVRGLDYVLFGTVFETASKPGRQAAGVRRLADVAAATPVPVLAVGGVMPERMPDVAASGAAGMAAIGLFAGIEIGELSSVVGRLTRAFDTRKSAAGQ